MLRQCDFDKLSLFSRGIRDADVDGATLGCHNFCAERVLAQIHLSAVTGVNENGGDGACDLDGEAGRSCQL